MTPRLAISFVFSPVLILLIFLSPAGSISTGEQTPAARRHGSNLVVEYAAGIGDLGRNRYLSAEKRFNLVAQQSTDSVLSMRSSFLAGWCNYKLSQWRKSAQWFGKYLKGNGILKEYAAYYRAESLTRAKDYEKARAAWRIYLSTYPKSNRYREARLSQCDTLAALGKCDMALPLLGKLLKTTEHGDQRARIILKIGNCLEALKKVSDAKGKYREIYIYRPGSGSAPKAAARLKALGADANKMPNSKRFARAEKLYKRARWEAALAEYEKLLEDKKFDRKNHDGRLTAIRRAMCLYRLYRTKEAAEAFRSFFTTIPVGEFTSTAYYYYGHCMGRLEKKNEALQAYKNVTEKTPASSLAPRAWLNVSQIYSEWDRWDDAVRCLETIRKKYPGRAGKMDISWRIGWIHYRRGKFDAAANSFVNHKGKKEITSRRNAYWAARALGKKGENKEAKKQYRAILKDKPHDYYSLWARTRLGKKPVEPKKTARPRAHKVPNLMIKDDRLDRSRELAQMGLVEFAVEELGLLEKRKGLSKSDHEAICMLYQAYGDYYRSRRAVYRYLDIDKDNYSAGNDRYWRILYPRAYSAQVSTLAAERGLSPNHVWSIIMQESNFRAGVVSSAGAMGLMQLIPPTARQMARRLKITDFRRTDLFNPAVNIRMGINYLADVAAGIGTHNGRLYMATAGYNGGPSNVKRWARARTDLEIDEWVEEIPFNETKNYVKRVFSNWSVYEMLYGKAGSFGVPVPVGEKISKIATGVIK